MMKKVLVLGLAFTPALAFAQVIQEQSLTGVVKFVRSTMDTATVLILAAAVVFFLWGVFQFVMSAGNDEERTKGRDHIIYGLVGIAVMVSVWGLVKFLTTTFGTSSTSGTAISAPPLPN
jgi:hypothetical protein